MIWEAIVGFVLIVVGSYVGATMALRGYFGREYRPKTGDEVDDTDRTSK